MELRLASLVVVLSRSKTLGTAIPWASLHWRVHSLWNHTCQGMISNDPRTVELAVTTLLFTGP